MTARASLIAGGAAVLTLLLAWWLVIAKPAHDRQAAIEAKAGAAIAQGQSNAARDAVGVVVDISGEEARIHAQTQTNRDAILSAPGAGQAVDPAGDLAARRAICLRSSARHSAACQRLLNPRPG